MRCLALLLLASLALALPAHADDDHDALRVPTLEPADALLDAWERDGAWLISPEQVEAGSRVAVLLEADAAPTVEVQADDGPWLPTAVTYAANGFFVLAADLDTPAERARVRLFAPQRRLAPLAGVITLGWRALDPVPEPGGNAPGAPLPPPPGNGARAVSAALLDIGVVPRETWGASGTNCSTPENNWYRFAVHHTAGPTTSGGTVQGAVQSLQAWAMGGGGFCDIPYQFLVGYDGSLWEGRNLSLYSGATGGGNNDGNIAISHLGCFHPSPGCPSPDSAGLSMRAAGRLLAQTLAVEHGITTNSDTLRGHRDYPGNSTACPGDYIWSALDEYRSPTAHYEGTVTGTSWSGVIELPVGSTASHSVTIRNDGLLPFTADTKLAPLPRDQASPLASGAWLSGNRVSAPSSDVAPGASFTFPLELEGAAVGSYDLSFTLVQESVTWFPDQPIGGGPLAGEITVTVLVVEAGDDDDDDDTAADDDDTPADDDDTSADDDDSGVSPSPRVGGERIAWLTEPEGNGCGCKGDGASAALLLLLPLGLRRRR